MKKVTLGLAVAGMAVALLAASSGSTVNAATTVCETTVEVRSTPAEPVSIDRDGDLLLVVSGHEGLLVARPDGSWVDLNNFVSLDGDWAVQGYAARMLPDGTVLGYARNFDVPQLSPGYSRGFVWKDDALTWLRGGADPMADDVSTTGMVVGGQRSSASGQRAVYWPTATSRPRPLASKAAFIESWASEIDRDGTIYGKAKIASGASTAWVWVKWVDDRVRVMRFPDGFTASVVSNGRAAGYVTAQDGSRRPALWDSDGLWIPPIPDGASGSATELTSKGEFGGMLTAPDGTDNAFVGRASEDLRYIPLTTGPERLNDLRSFDNVTALTSEGAVTRCIYP